MLKRPALVCRLLLIVLIFAVSCFTVDALTIEPGVVLKTTSSNSSVTFSFQVNMTDFTLESTYVYLYNVSYIQSGSVRNCNVNHSTANTVLDSANFCVVPSPPSGGGSSGRSSTPPVYTPSRLINYTDVPATKAITTDKPAVEINKTIENTQVLVDSVGITSTTEQPQLTRPYRNLFLSYWYWWIILIFIILGIILFAFKHRMKKEPKMDSLRVLVQKCRVDHETGRKMCRMVPQKKKRK